MTFDEILEQVITLLKRQGRVSYPALKIRFNLADDYLEALKAEILYVHPVIDDEGKGLIWTGEPGTQSEPVSTQPIQQEVTQKDQPVQAEPPPPEPPTPDAERRQLTVMFSDLVDSTKLSGQLDPEDYREVLRSYQATCSEVIQRFEGYIAQHLGDALLVYFGFPVAHENDAHRGILAGLGMLEAMKTLNERLEQDKGIRLAIRVGIHTGLTVIGDVGEGQKHEMLALGEAPNVASRIQGLAESDTIAVSDATYRLVDGYFTCQDLGEHSLKGVAEPVQVYRVLQESGAQSRLEIATSRGLTPLVGREQEVGLLLERWELVKDAQGQVVLLSGEAGIGKSRLVQVLKDHLSDEPHIRLECRSSPYYQNTALHPMTDLLGRTLQFQREDAPEAKLSKLEAFLNQYRLPLDESVPLFALLLSLAIPEDRYPPLNLSPQRHRQKTLETIVAMLVEQAEHQPVLFIIEDLHWLDPTSLELLDLLIDQSPTASIYTLLTCRPEFQLPWSSRSYLTQVTLHRLSRTQVARMAEQVADGKTLPDDVLQQIVEKTDGVPLFVEEMTKAVLESGVLKETDNAYELTGSLSSLAIPVTLQDSLMARLDRLVTAKGIAQYASVIGRQCAYALLYAVSQVDEATLQKALSRLVEAELLYQRGLPPQATYTFKHALIQDAAYQSLLKSTRQQYHQRIAQVLEAQFSQTAEAQPELLAHHYTEAGLTEKAVHYWHHAGQRAIERSSHVEALSHLTKGLALLQPLTHTPEHARQELAFQTALGQALITVRGYAADEVEHVYLRARALSQEIDDTREQIRALMGLYVLFFVRANHEAVHALTGELLHLGQAVQDPLVLIQTYAHEGESLLWQGKLAQARTHLEHGMSLYRPQRYAPSAYFFGHHPVVQNLSILAFALWALGYPDRAVQQCDQALTFAQGLSHPFSLAFALSVKGQLHQLRRETDIVQEYAETLVIVSTENGFPFRAAHGSMLLGWAMVDRGEKTAGVARTEEGHAAFQTTGAKLQGSWWLALRAEASRKIGQVEEGLTVLVEALTAVKNTGEHFYEAEIHRLKGELLLQQSPDNHPEAESCFQKAIGIAQNQQAKSWELRAATSLSRLWKQQGKRDEARQLLAEVYGWFTEGFGTADLIEAKSLLDELEDGR